jgi:hypothetical protein
MKPAFRQSKAPGGKPARVGDAPLWKVIVVRIVLTGGNMVACTQESPNQVEAERQESGWTAIGHDNVSRPLSVLSFIF